MKPIGLTLKDIKTNPYTGRTSGELMVVHQCLGCGKISCNRIAGDDNPHTIIQLLENTERFYDQLITELSCQGIELLSRKDKQTVQTALYGYNYKGNK